MPALATFTPKPRAPQRAALTRSGVRVWDERGAVRIDFDMGGGSVLLGHAHPRVEAAVAAGRGIRADQDIATEALAELAPCAEAARFCAEESQALPAAIAAARTVTGRQRAAVFEEGGALVDLDDLAAIVVDTLGPSRAHLDAAARLADAAGAVLIFDEGASSFRIHERGAQGLSHVAPHLSVFGGAIANGRPLGAIAGQAELVDALDESDLGAVRPASIAAAGATLQRLIRDPVAHRLAVMGSELQAEVSDLAQRSGAERFFSLAGDPSLPLPVFSSPQLEGLWMQECARAGLVCIAAHGLCAAHTEADLAQLIGAYRTALPVLAASGLMALMARTSSQPVPLISGVS